MVSGIVEVAMRVMVVLLLAPRLAFRGVAFAEISAWVGAGVMLMITYFFIRGGSPGNSRCERIKGEVIYKTLPAQLCNIVFSKTEKLCGQGLLVKQAFPYSRSRGIRPGKRSAAFRSSKHLPGNEPAYCCSYGR